MSQSTPNPESPHPFKHPTRGSPTSWDSTPKPSAGPAAQQRLQCLDLRLASGERGQRERQLGGSVRGGAGRGRAGPRARRWWRPPWPAGACRCAARSRRRPAGPGGASPAARVRVRCRVRSLRNSIHGIGPLCGRAATEHSRSAVAGILAGAGTLAGAGAGAGAPPDPGPDGSRSGVRGCLSGWSPAPPGATVRRPPPCRRVTGGCGGSPGRGGCGRGWRGTTR